jgi:conjugative transfer signal peptidase TraF
MMTGLFDRIRATPFRKVRRIGLIAFGVLLATFEVFGLVGLRLNFSPSLPVGVYVESRRANLVEFCPAEPFGSLAIARGYREEGSCRDGAAPLLKPIVAKPGDVVELSAEGISVNGWLLQNTAPLPKDAKGRALTPFPPGRYTVEPGYIWVASSYNPRSFDSRYFGPVPQHAIRAHLRPLLMFASKRYGPIQN